MDLKKLKTMQKIEYNLRIPSKYKKTWIVIGIISLIIIGLTTLPIIYLNIDHSQTIDNNIKYNIAFANASKILCYVSWGLITTPYLYLSASWIVGIDNITKSSRYHMYIWVIYSIASFLTILAIILCFRATLI